MFTSTLSFYLPVSVGLILSPNNLSLISYLFNVCVCVHVHLWSGCVQIYLLMHAGPLGGQRLVKTFELFFRCCLHHVFWDGVCHWLRVYQVGKAGRIVSPRDPPICASPGQEDKCVPPQIWLCVCVCSGDWTQVLMLAQPVFRWQSHLSCLPVLVLNVNSAYRKSESGFPVPSSLLHVS